MKKLSIIIAMLLVVALAVPTFANPFTDVPANHWAYEAVNKLVAAGIISGYPDGTYKGQNNLTRYEIAVVVSRALDNIAAEREALANGLTTEQAQDVTAIVKALMEQNQPEQSGTVEYELPESLTDEQADEVANLIEALTFEFKAELKVLGAKIDAIGALEDRVEALENPVVSFSGSYEVAFNHGNGEGAVVDDDTELNYYWVDAADIATVNSEIETYLTNNPDKDFDDAVEHYNTNVAATDADKIMMDEDDVDPYVTVPWTDGDETITVDDSKEFDQTLTFKTNIAKDGFAATLDLDATEDEDEMAIDSIGLTLENDAVKATYNEANSVAFADYAYNEKDIDGVKVNFKNYGVDTFFGTKEVDSGVAEDTQEKTEDPDGDGWEATVEKDVVQYEEDEDQLVAMSDTTDYYAYGAAKTFALGGLDVDAKFAGERKADQAEGEETMTNIIGFATGTELSGMAVDFDMAYSMDKAADVSDSLFRLGLNNDLDVASVEFNYRNVGENFSYMHEDAVLTDSDEDDYDLFTNAMDAGLSGFDFTVKPNILEDLDASVFYASVNDADDAENTKLALTGEMAVLMDGLTVNGLYESKDEAGDETKTMGFGAEYALIPEKATATFDYTSVDPVEDATDWTTEDKEKEKTMALGLDYTVNDYVTADFGYEKVTSLGHVEDMNKTATSFGADLTDYPVMGDLTVSAGFGYDVIAGEEFDDADPTAVNPTETPSVESLEEKATELSLGLGYTLGAADLSYDLTNTRKEGDGVDDGTYTTHKAAVTYPVVEGTDFTADYSIYDFVSDEDSDDNFKVNVATAGVTIEF